MINNTVNLYNQNDLREGYSVKEKVKSFEFHKLGVKTTACLLTTKEGFEIVGTSACVNPKDFSQVIGEYYAMKAALDKLEELDGYSRQLIYPVG